MKRVAGGSKVALMVAGAFGFMIAWAGCGGGETTTFGCTSDSECDEGLICNMDTNQCAPDNSVDPDLPCFSSSNCATGRYCIKASITGTGSNECGIPANCNDIVDTSKDIACGEGSECLENGCSEVESTDDTCTIDTDCKRGEVCGRSGVCVAGCLSAADCPPMFSCDLSTNMCVQVMGCMSGADCDEGEACDRETGRCIPGCRDSFDCGNEEVCIQGSCLMVTRCSQAQSPRAYCAARIEPMEGETVECVDGMCVTKEPEGPVSPYYHILISDISTEGCEDANTEGKFDPGSDIMYVELLDAEDQTIAWGSTADYQRAPDPANDYRDASILDGMAPSLIMDGSEDEGCPDGDDRFSDMTVVSLGCGGNLIVGFDVPIYNDYTVRVGEYAPICNQDMGGSPTGTTDKYEVYLCPESAPQMPPSTADCLVDGTAIHASVDGGIKACVVTGSVDLQ